MATTVIMPRQGQSVESCIITQWHKQVGDPVSKGDVLFSYETDKASFDEEAKTEGLLLEIFFGEEEDVPVLTPVAVIGAEGEDPAPHRPEKAASPETVRAEEVEQKRTGAEPEETAARFPTTQASTPASDTPPGQLRISPRARNLARRLHIDPTAAQGTGPDGRILARDIDQAAQQLGTARTASAFDAAPGQAAALLGSGLGGRTTAADLEAAAPSPQETAPASDGFTDVPLTRMRKTIAEGMYRSVTETAQLSLDSSFDASSLLDCRRQIKAASGDDDQISAITINDMILYAAARVLLRHPDLNAHFRGDHIRRFHHAHLGFAVDTERGLMVPTIRDADQKSLAVISHEAAGLAAACSTGSINPDTLQGASFTITNLGPLGIESFTPVLNPPQTGILGVNTVVERPRTGKNGLELYPAMGLSLTFDHRALDGAPAARFLQDLTQTLEQFVCLLVKDNARLTGPLSNAPKEVSP